MNSKSLTLKRIIIFCIIAFLPLCIVTAILNSSYGEMIFVSEKATASAYVLGCIGMFMPAVANILTRLITKEGFDNVYLEVNFKGNTKYYIASVVVKIIENIICVLLAWSIFFKDFNFTQMFPAQNFSQGIAVFLLQISVSIIVFFPAFGEEFGWRGYLGPKLTELMSKPAAIITGGIIWGLWHAPLTVSGHNFGIAYPFYPWLGIFLMCIMCTLINAFLTLLTEKTKSIYPASFCHMINNNLSFGVILSLFAGENAINKLSDISSIHLFFLYLPILAVTGGVSLWILLHDSDN